MFIIYVYMQILCYLSSQESNQLFIYMYHNSVNAASEASGVSIMYYIVIPDERGALATSELQCPSVSDDHKSICYILYIERATAGSEHIIYLSATAGSETNEVSEYIYNLIGARQAIRIEKYLVYRNIVYRIILQQYIVNTVQILIYSKKENSGKKIRGSQPRHFKNFPPGDIYIIYIIGTNEVSDLEYIMLIIQYIFCCRYFIKRETSIYNNSRLGYYGLYIICFQLMFLLCVYTYNVLKTFRVGYYKY